jgi:hypothetical protein
MLVEVLYMLTRRDLRMMTRHIGELKMSCRSEYAVFDSIQMHSKEESVEIYTIIWWRFVKIPIIGC